MRSASREALGQAGEELEQIVQGASQGSGEELARLGDELYSAANALNAHLDLRRPLVDPSLPERARTSLVEGVFGGKVGEQTIGLVTTLVRHRLSSSIDLVEAVEDLGRDASLAAAEAEGTLSEVEDELFRFGRLLEREPRLFGLLSDTTTPADKRIELLDSLLEGRAETITRRLLAQLVRHPYSRPLDRGAEVLAEAAASRRNRSIARVISPVALGEEQERRLADALSSLYERQISVHVDVDPEILGGLVVRVGGEVIDGSVAGRLQSAAGGLPG